MMTKEEINTVKIMKHHQELQKAVQLKAKYESLPDTDIFWQNFHKRELARLERHLKEKLPTNIQVEEKNWNQIDFDLLYDLCYVDIFNQASGMHNSVAAYQKLEQLVASKKYWCIDISGIKRRGGGAEYSHVIKAYRYTGDVKWFRDGHIYKLNDIIKTKKGAITLLSKKLTKPLNLVIDQVVFNPIVPPELKSGLMFPSLTKIDWTKHEPGTLTEADMESCLLINPKQWGLEDWYPVAQQHSLSQNGRIDAIFGNSAGQLLLVELELGNLSKDHYSKITVYRRQLAKDWNVDLKSIGMLVIANGCNPVLQECCQDLNIQLIIKTKAQVRSLVASTRAQWEKLKY